MRQIHKFKVKKYTIIKRGIERYCAAMDIEIVRNIVFNHPLELIFQACEKEFRLRSIRERAWKFNYNRCVKEIEIMGLTPPYGKVYVELVNEYQRKPK